MKRILVIATGGTIASRAGGEGLTPEIPLEQLLNYVPQIRQHCELEAVQIMNLDSTNMQPSDWLKITRTIREHYDRFDGLIILHGTDTMAYTAAALSYLIQNSRKPIILTGAQKPIDQDISDAKSNVIQSVLYACDDRASDVNFVFNGRVIAGTRGRKVRTRSFDAFESIDYPYAARINSGGLVVNPGLQRKRSGACVLKNQFCTDVFLLKLFPGISPDIFRRLEDMGIRGVYVEAFGIGGLPFWKRNLSKAIGEAVSRGMVVAVGSQCLYEGSDFTVYEVGRQALEQGVIETGNMTTEAAVTKLMWALGQYGDPEKVRKLMGTNLLGEMGRSGDWNSN